MLYLQLVTLAIPKNNNTIGVDQALENLITTSDTVIARALYISKVETIFITTGKELDPIY